MKIKLSIVSFFMGIIALPWAAASAQTPAGFTIQLISTFDYPGTGNLTRPQKINDHGDIIGIYEDSSLVTRGFIRFSNGRFSAPLVDPNDTGNLTEGRGINNSRLSCGDYLDSSLGIFHGFFLTGNTYTTYDVPGSTGTVVLGVNNANDFCGFATIGTAQEGYLSIGGTVTEFEVSGASSTLAYQLNDSDQSCGYYIDTSAITHGFYRDSDGTIHAPVDPAGSTTTILFGNNARNLIVGRYVDGSGATHGLLFMPPNRFVIYDYPGATFTSLNGINKQNMIVGRYTDSGGIDHGIIAQAVRSASGDASQLTLPLARPLPQMQGALARPVDTAPAF